MNKLNPEIYHRHSMRLKNYDYSTAGAYFITICTQNRECLFGEIGQPPVVAPTGEMILNDAGQMINNIWHQIPNYYPGNDIDEFRVIPNHIHGIIIAGTGEIGQPQGVAPATKTIGLSLSDIIHRFKTLTTKKYTEGVKYLSWPPFRGKLWQRNYYEHIVRDENELNQIREYIRYNPINWELDNEYSR